MTNFSSIIYFSTIDWNAYWIIQQPVANELSKNYPVLFVERNVSVFTILRYPRMWKKLFLWMRGVRKIKNNLYIYSPIPSFHLGHKFPKLFLLDHYVKSIIIKTITIFKKEFSNPLLFFDNPYYQNSIQLFPQSKKVYHVGDELSAFSTSDAKIISLLEQNFLKKVDYIFCAATKLYEDKKQYNQNTYIVWNAIDHEVFNKKNIREIEEFSKIKKPVVGFVGVVSSWFDYKLYDTITDLLPEYSFVIVGRFTEGEPIFLKKKNVHFMGSRPRTEIPSILSSFDVGIIPFVKSKLVENILPLKYFEYLAVGKPIVSTRFSPDMEKVQPNVILAETAMEFAEAIKKVISEDSQVKVEERIKIALECTWENRTKQMLSIIQS